MLSLSVLVTGTGVEGHKYVYGGNLHSPDYVGKRGTTRDWRPCAPIKVRMLPGLPFFPWNSTPAGVQKREKNTSTSTSLLWPPWYTLVCSTTITTRHSFMPPVCAPRTPCARVAHRFIFIRRHPSIFYSDNRVRDGVYILGDAFTLALGYSLKTMFFQVFVRKLPTKSLGFTLVDKLTTNVGNAFFVQKKNKYCCTIV